MRTRPVCLALALAIMASPVLAAVRSPDEPLAFRPVPGAGASVLGVVRPTPLPPVRLARAEPLRAAPSRPPIHVPEPPVIVVSRLPGLLGVAQGEASWYCGHGSPCTAGHPGGLYAAAGPALRVGGDWRGRYVRVVGGDGRMVHVQLIDCNCGPDANLIDLYSDAFERLAPLSRGVLTVEVSW